jgi:MarR family transcriptional regulator, transcriptional regulator for hemolysin
MNIDKISLGNQLGEMLRNFAITLQNTLAESKIDFTIEQFAVLSILNEHENLTQQDIASMLSKDKSGVLRHIDNLEMRKFVVRVADEHDRRKKLLVITKKGYEAVTGFEQIKKSTFEKIFKDLSQQQLDTFSETLTIIQKNIK